MVSTTLYLALMATAAVVSLIRGFVVAALLPPEDFAVYAVAVALGALLANFLSFGLIEGTVKQFPRLVMAGGAGSLLRIADGGARRLAIRALMALPVLGVVMYLVDSSRPLLFLAVAAVSFGAAWLSLLASVQRAMLNVLNVALANGARALLYLTLALVGAAFFGLAGAVAGEIVGALLGALVSREIFKATLRRNAHRQPASAANVGVSAEAGVTVFIAYSALSVPLYLDRVYVAGVFGIKDAATYAVLALFAGGATVFVNIVAQKVGPEIIARERAGMALSELLALATRWSVAVAIIWGAVICAVAWASSAGWLAFLAKYELTQPMFWAILALGCVQVASIFEFILLARDLERTFLGLALGHLALVCVVAGFAASDSLSLPNFIYLLSFAKLAYLGAMLVTLRSEPQRAVPKGTRS
jgi:O-antigen/teichoic acid export membrane protein